MSNLEIALIVLILLANTIGALTERLAVLSENANPPD